MKKTEIAAKALWNKMVEANFKEFTITMKKSGDQITISPCYYGEGTPKSDKDIEYYLVYAPINLGGADSLEELAQTIINYDAIKEEDGNTRNRLRAFFEEHIKGHTSEELSVGNDICCKAYDIYSSLTPEEKSGITYVFDDKLNDIYLKKYMEAHPEYDADYLGKCFTLANNFSTYSDWYKDVFCHRPRSLEVF